MPRIVQSTDGTRDSDSAAPLLLPAVPVRDLEEYQRRGGGIALEMARRDGDAVLAVLEATGIRGRGGAQFPTATKWRSVREADSESGDRFVVLNGAEGEPGSFKDRLLIRRNPFQVLEGALVAAHIVGAREAFIGVKASSSVEIAVLHEAIADLERGGMLDVPIRVVEGPDEYLFGEEKAMLEVIEGEEPLPRTLPPYQYGLFSSSPNIGWSANADRSANGPAEPAANPTLVNNVETFAAVTAALRVGADAYRTQGTDTSPGTLLVTVSGDTVRAGVAEVAYGTTLRQVIDEVGGGLPDGNEILAVLSGVANAVLTDEHLDLPLTHDAFAAAGLGLGAGGFIVLDQRRHPAAVARDVAWFLHVESCGQCTPCKTGTGTMASTLAPTDDQPHADSDAIARSLVTVDANARCYLPTQARIVVSSLISVFPNAFTDALPPESDSTSVAKIVDIVDGVAVLDDRQRHKRPDWTYADTPVRIGSA